MDVNRLHAATLAVTSLLCVFAYEVTVKSSDLMLCKEDNRVCATKSQDCVPPPSIQKTLNMSCYFDVSQWSMTCEWSEDLVGHAAADASLIFKRSRPVIDCRALFTYIEQLMITARIKSSSMEIWSQPHHVFLFHAVKPSPPELCVVSFTEDSVVLDWGSRSGGSCRLRYRAHSSKTWSQVPDFVSTPQNPKRSYSIKGLQPFTVYTAAVACSQEFGVWSNWSAGVSVRTLDRVPSKSPHLCYRLEKTDSSGLLLHLMWKALDPHDAGGRILGYQVKYRRVMARQLQDRCVVNVTEGVSALEVDEGNWSVSVAAFNTAGFGPSASLSIDTKRQKYLPSVRNVWVSTSLPAGEGLWVQWKVTTDPAQPVSHFDVWWCPETNTSTSRWSTVNSSTSSTLIQGVDPTQSYRISVVAVYEQQCGSPQSVSASLPLGALTEPTKLKVTGVNKTAVTVTWVWQRKSGPVRVNGYRVMLRSDSQKQTQALWPDQRQHTFLNLTPNTEYSLDLMADNVSTNIISVRTDFDKFPVVATAMPLLLLAVLITSILSRTMYRGFFYPRVSSPQHSTAGQWLMDHKHTVCLEKLFYLWTAAYDALKRQQINTVNFIKRNILDIQDFQETDVLGVKSAIVIGPRCSDPLIHRQLSDLRLDAGYYEPGAPRATTHHLQRLPGDEDREAALPLHQTRGTEGSVPRTEEEDRQLDCQASQQAVDAAKCSFRELVADADSHCTAQITCEEEYVVNSCYVGKADAEMEQTVVFVICDTDYLPNTAVQT